MDVRTLDRLLLIRYTLFGLTWLGASALLPYLQKDAPPLSLRSWLLLLLAFSTARSSGMLFNNLFDRTFDAQNPRTKDRPLPKGEVSPMVTGVLAVGLLALFLAISWSINELSGLLSLAVGLAIVLYSLTKRITPLCHLALGAIYFFAPFCAWAAVTGEISPTPLLFGSALFFIITGSDIIYACQDVEFDQSVGLFSIPAWLGIKGALTIAAIMHALSVAALTVQGLVMGSTPFLIGAFCIGCILSFSYLKLLLGQISYMAAFSRINMMSGCTIFFFVLVQYLCRDLL